MRLAPSRAHGRRRYTPLLPGAAVGTVESRSIVEPIRKPLAAKGFSYYEASALRVDPASRTVLCRAAELATEVAGTVPRSCLLHTFNLEYDLLVLACGAVPNTFGIPGVAENACFFKELPDAIRFRKEVSERFERAALPDMPADRAKELLTFVFVGAGPTGVELAAELHDLVVNDISRLYPRALLAHVSIELVDLQDFVLSSYDRRIAEYATAQFRRQKIVLHLGALVQEVKPNALVLKDKKTGAVRELPFGMCVWCSGIKLNALAERLIGELPEGSQPNFRSLTTDASLRVKGSAGSIFALGDCATIELKTAAAHAGAMLLPGERLGQAALAELLKRQSEEFPHLAEAAERVVTESPSLFAKFCAADSTVGAEELAPLLASMDRGLRSLPATAQVAKQEGEFVASLFKEAGGDLLTLQEGALAPFSYRHKGSLAYVGSDAAVADIPGFSILKGFFAGIVWKGFETASQVSLRNVFLVAADLLRAKLFGRDLSSWGPQ